VNYDGPPVNVSDEPDGIGRQFSSPIRSWGERFLALLNGARANSRRYTHSTFVGRLVESFQSRELPFYPSISGGNS
jgi:hypothetical protein